MTLVPKEGGIAELVDLFVDPDHLRQGIGRVLIADAVASAQKHAVRRIEVDANPNALPFYEAAHFTAVGTIETEFGTGWRLALEIAPP
ncbi:MAG: GNAT family N-acetyltransferase [Candidatus Dormibacteria bacterium]